MSCIEDVEVSYWGISVGGDGILSKAGIVSGLFTEELEEELKDTPPKNENDVLVYRDSNEPRKNTDEDLMNLYVKHLSELSK